MQNLIGLIFQQSARGDVWTRGCAWRRTGALAPLTSPAAGASSRTASATLSPELLWTPGSNAATGKKSYLVFNFCKLIFLLWKGNAPLNAWVARSFPAATPSWSTRAETEIGPPARMSTGKTSRIAIVSTRKALFCHFKVKLWFQLRVTLRAKTAASASLSTGVSVQWSSEVSSVNTVSFFYIQRL